MEEGEERDGASERGVLWGGPPLGGGRVARGESCSHGVCWSSGEGRE